MEGWSGPTGIRALAAKAITLARSETATQSRDFQRWHSSQTTTLQTQPGVVEPFEYPRWPRIQGVQFKEIVLGLVKNSHEHSLMATTPSHSSFALRQQNCLIRQMRPSCRYQAKLACLCWQYNAARESNYMAASLHSSTIVHLSMMTLSKTLTLAFANWHLCRS